MNAKKIITLLLAAVLVKSCTVSITFSFVLIFFTSFQ